MQSVVASVSNGTMAASRAMATGAGKGVAEALGMRRKDVAPYSVQRFRHGLDMEVSAASPHTHMFPRPSAAPIFSFSVWLFVCLSVCLLCIMCALRVCS